MSIILMLSSLTQSKESSSCTTPASTKVEEGVILVGTRGVAGGGMFMPGDGHIV